MQQSATSCCVIYLFESTIGGPASTHPPTRTCRSLSLPALPYLSHHASLHCCRCTHSKHHLQLQRQQNTSRLSPPARPISYQHIFNPIQYINSLGRSCGQTQHPTKLFDFRTTLYILSWLNTSRHKGLATATTLQRASTAPLWRGWPVCMHCQIPSHYSGISLTAIN